ncbi:CBS domain containing protein [Nitrosococcus halophilus Nc 4]|uniref:CBS domain containing protein n=1 Tax=Nitrosococcus halophilus (strain Nc4) TaxID=472759 RepID=D5C3M6_NITHN|nr:CBS domain-containing protein [Nitrosococcus halophilus]ADE14998.1 CBS domain containing protein [Nitrosococcus halophilus Nc 4]
MNVKDLMIKNVATCGPETTLDTVALLMWDKDCGSIPIVDGEGALIGVITDRDIAMGCGLNHKAPWEITAREVWNNRQVFTSHPDDDIHTALQAMSEHRIRRLLVTDGNGHLEGILSADDIVACSEKGMSGRRAPELSYDDTMGMLKTVCIHH